MNLHKKPAFVNGLEGAPYARATELAREYEKKLHTGILYRNPNPPPTYGQGVIGRERTLKKRAVPRHEILNRFKPAG